MRLFIALIIVDFCGGDLLAHTPNLKTLKTVKNQPLPQRKHGEVPLQRSIG
jgi:hypothetical protein